MSETAELAAALAAVQAELPEVKKNRNADVKNKEGRYLYSYSYADLADVSTAIMPILGKHGLAFTAFPGHQPDGKFGLRYYLLHCSGAQLEGFYEISDRDGMQLMGGRITYARRYCLCAVTGIAAEEDVDARGDAQTRSPRRQPASDNGDQQTARTAQRTARRRQAPTQTAPPAAEAPATPRPETEPAGEAPMPPLPGEDEPAAEPDGSKRHRALVGIVQQHFKRLGYTDSDDEKRLADTAKLAGTSGIGSTNDLDEDELSTVADALARCKNRAALDALLNAAGDIPGDSDG